MSASKAAYIQLGAIVLAIGFIGATILLTGESPHRVIAALWNGAFGTPDRIARCFSTLVPLVLCASGLVFTFAAGLYNLGVEGQITAGAIATTFTLRLGETLLPPSLLLPLAIVMGGLGGTVWGGATGILTVYGRINEIFAGLGLNFVIEGLALYLVFGPWKREGVASMSGTEPFPEALHLGTIGRTEASPVALGIAIVALGATILVMRSTYIGLKLRAVGKNQRAAYVLGIPAVRYLMGSLMA
ncbi:MAG: ABC transporter permease, partial [Cyanobacteria bacterium]|nr:ABC transporter permease [Cyanobacteriota bacterium]MDW8201525.1 ABC transporter permease [Cyanobacteriota bacterium SKYGB_h_bin112]